MAPNAKRPGSPQPGLAAEVSAPTHSSLKTGPREDTHIMQPYRQRSRVVSLPTSRLGDFPASRAFALPPVPGRTMWAVPVLRCSLCGGGHVHRTADADMLLAGKLVRRCPATGRKHRLGPVQRRNEARRIMRLALAA